MDIRNELEQLRDEKYREFVLSLLPNVDKSKMIGVRLPQLRAVAARIKKESPKGVMPDLPICLKKSLCADSLLQVPICRSKSI